MNEKSLINLLPMTIFSYHVPLRTLEFPRLFDIMYGSFYPSLCKEFNNFVQQTLPTCGSLLSLVILNYTTCSKRKSLFHMQAKSIKNCIFEKLCTVYQLLISLFALRQSLQRLEICLPILYSIQSFKISKQI